MKDRREHDIRIPSRTRKVIIKPVSTRQVKRFLKKPLSQTSAVIYFAEKDSRPFLLGPDGGGVSAGGQFGLSENWKLTKDKLDRIFIIASEKDVAEDMPNESESPKEET